MPEKCPVIKINKICEEIASQVTVLLRTCSIYIGYQDNDGLLCAKFQSNRTTKMVNFFGKSSVFLSSILACLDQ